jgi:type II secretory ATPase GspE/PulE/Tfp pilus assembly ATPase PilB-like protein
MLAGMVSRIKVMADLNIAEKRAPQDGAISFQNGRHDYDLRVSTIPALYGEKAVIRLLGGSSRQLSMADLGLSDEDSRRFKRIIGSPYGILLIVGPTGSGKSTTLSAALSTIKRPEINITTVEDPVEYKIDGIVQVHVGQSDKISFASALRSILRQDPDVIMVGEVRDSETADITLRAALTGHMVFTTLHTNDAPSALPRLMDMGCEPFLVSSSVRGILAQRLVRRLCPRCREPYEPSEEERIGLGLDPAAPMGTWFRKQGCPACGGSGYKGRIGIFELLETNEPIRRAILSGQSTEELRKLARSTAGMKTMREDAILKVQNGITTTEEVFRATLDD